MINGDQIAIAKETGMGTNMYPCAALLGRSKDASIASLPVDELTEKADGFAGVFSEHKCEIVKELWEKKHICGMIGDGVNDAPVLKKADIGIAVTDSTDAARGFGFMFIALIWKFDFSPFMVYHWYPEDGELYGAFLIKIAQLLTWSKGTIGITLYVRDINVISVSKFVTS